MRKGLLTRTVLLGAVLFVCFPTIAQDSNFGLAKMDSVYSALKERILLIEEAEIRASMGDVARPAMVPSEIIEVQKLDQIPAASRIEALTALPGVNMVSSGGGTMRPVIRGLSGMRVATVFNGARIESQAWGEYHGIYLPEEGVRAVEVIRGPATLAFGSDAYGGVLNFIPNAPLQEQGRESRISLSGFSATSGWQITGATEKRSTSTFHAFRGGYKQHDNYRLPSGQRVFNSGYQQFFGQGTFGYIRPWGVIEGAYSSAYNSAGLIGHAGWQQSGDHLMTTSVRWRWKNWDLKPRVSYQLNHRKEFETPFGSGPQEESTEEELALDISLRTVRFDMTAHRETMGDWSTTLGLQGFSTDSRFDNDGDVALVHEPLIPNSGADEVGVFTVWNREVSDVGVQFSGRLDRRVTAVGTTLDGVDSSESRVDYLGAVSAGAHWKLSPQLVLRMHATRSERVPGLSELYSNGIHHCAFRFEQGDAFLKKEQSVNIETRVDWRHAWGNVEASVYQNSIDDYVQIAPTGSTTEGWEVYAWEATDALFRGVEIAGNFAAPHWKHVHMDYAFSAVNARDRLDVLLPLIPPATMRTVLGWKEWQWGALHGIFAQAVWNHNRDASLVHLAAGATLNEVLSLNVSVQNLLDTEFIPTLSMLQNLGIPEPGRNVRLQLSWVF